MAGSFSLLPGEEINLESAKVSLQLTNFRVRHRFFIFSDPQLDSITLDAVASTGLRVISKPGLLVLAAILLLVALAVNGLPFGAGSNAAGAIVVFAVLLAIAYALGRRRSIAIESKGGHCMLVPALNLTLDECYFLINAIDRAKLEFLKGELPQP